MSLTELLAGIEPADANAGAQAKARWDSIAHPLGSLGLLETAVIRIAAMTGSPDIDISRRAVVVMCADNGVVSEGVTQTDCEVTAVVTENMARGDSSVCRMAAVAHAEVIPVDIGVARPVIGERILQRNIRRGTRNMTREPAMTRAETAAAVEVGFFLAQTLWAQGFNLFATGEMGIGNTTSSSAMASVLLRCNPETVTGRGAGLSSDGLERKIDAVRRAIACNRPDPDDPLDILSKVGGLDIAGLVGVFLGCAACRVPVLIDGMISAVAALTAARLCSAVCDYLLPSHVSAEPAGMLLLDALGLKPLIQAELRLGEGTGAVAAMPLLDMAVAVYNGMPTFGDTGIPAYRPLK